MILRMFMPDCVTGANAGLLACRCENKPSAVGALDKKAPHQRCGA